MASEQRPPLTTHQQSAAWSLATRLSIWYAGSAFALVLAVTAYLYWALATHLDQENDRYLADKVRVLGMLLRARPDDVAALRQEVELELGAHQHILLYVRILDENGGVIVETPEMARLAPAELFPPPGGEEPGQGTEMRSPGGAKFRVLASLVEPGRPAATRVVQVALDRSYEDQLLADYRRNAWLVLGIALVVCALGSYQLARRGIRPVQEITTAARQVRSTTLHQRIALAGLPAELAALADTFNDMLDRLEESFTRLSRFSADIAHELRTPVNILRGEAEVALGQPRSPEEYRAVLDSSLEECARLANMIDRLLFLARAENPQTQITREAVPVGRELAAIRDFYEPAAHEAGVTLAVATPDNLVAELDRPLFQRAVGNLVANAMAYTPSGGQVSLTASRKNGTIRVEVSDTGCGISPAHLPHIFDRFYRVDRARSTTTGGMGLGLAIVKSIAVLHGGSVDIRSEVGRGTCVAVVFPEARAISN